MPTGTIDKRMVLAAALIVFVALAVRIILLFDRLRLDPYFFALNSDNYYGLARQLLAGEYSLVNPYWQPGNIIWLATLISLFGPDMWTLYVINTAIGALSIGALIAAGRFAFGTRAGLMAGLIAALYPPLIFFHTTLQPATISLPLVSLAVLCGLWARRSYLSAALFGVVIGACGMVRPTLLLLGPAFAFALAIARLGRWKTFLLVSIAGICAVGVLMPQIIINRSVGTSSLISSNGPVNLYIGNNRDTDGTGINRPGQIYFVMRARKIGWEEALRREWKAAPLHIGALFLRKVGLFWGYGEIGNVIDYNNQARDISPLIRTLALGRAVGWPLLAWFALTGMVMYRSNRSMQMLASMLFLYMFATALFFVISRLRIPIAPVLCIAAAPAAVRLVDMLRTRRFDRQFVLAGCAALSFLLFARWLEHELPHKHFLDELPAQAYETAFDFGGELRLVGKAPIESNYMPGGYVYVTLYWQADAPTVDYSVFVHLLDQDNERIAGHDELVLGGVSYPVVGVTDWPTGAILSESYLIDIPEDAPPIMRIYAGVYDPATMTVVNLRAPDGTPTDQGMAYISALGLVMPDGFPALSGQAHPLAFRFGDALHLTRQDIRDAGPSPMLGLTWEASKPLGDDYTVFLHFFDRDMQLAAQTDIPLLRDGVPSSGMPPGEAISVYYPLPDDLPPGEYLVRMGIYRYPSFARLPVWDGEGNLQPDGLIDLTYITVTAGPDSP